jgi:hypothetical protein
MVVRGIVLVVVCKCQVGGVVVVGALGVMRRFWV